MTSPSIFDGKSDVLEWLLKIKAKLISKGYKSQLLDINRPAQAEARTQWDALADKAVGTILMYLSPGVAMQFEDKLTPQILMEAIKTHYKPDESQEIERLEAELAGLKYNGEDPVIWIATIKGLIVKLTSKQAKPADRTIKNVVLKALAAEPAYKVRVEVIKHSYPDITLEDLWIAISRFTYPIEYNDESVFVMNNKINTLTKKINKLKMADRYNKKNDYEKKTNVDKSNKSSFSDTSDEEKSSTDNKRNKDKNKNKNKPYNYSLFYKTSDDNSSKLKKNKMVKQRDYKIDKLKQHKINKHINTAEVLSNITDRENLLESYSLNELFDIDEKENSTRNSVDSTLVGCNTRDKEEILLQKEVIDNDFKVKAKQLSDKLIVRVKVLLKWQMMFAQLPTAIKAACEAAAKKKSSEHLFLPTLTGLFGGIIMVQNKTQENRSFNQIIETDNVVEKETEIQLIDKEMMKLETDLREPIIIINSTIDKVQKFEKYLHHQGGVKGEGIIQRNLHHHDIEQESKIEGILCLDNNNSNIIIETAVKHVCKNELHKRGKPIAKIKMKNDTNKKKLIGKVNQSLKIWQ